VRTARYPSWQAAARDAARLARAMTEKCALAGLAAGGGKAVVLDHPGLDRARGFAMLGERIEELGGLFRTAGDLGTTFADLTELARTTRFVHDEAGLPGAVGLSTLRCIEAIAARRGVGVAGLRVAIQGAGAIGGAVAQVLAGAGAQVLIADVDAARARAVAVAVGGQVVAPEDILAAEVDVVAPCARGGVLDAAAAARLRAWAVCGAANGVLADDGVAELLRARGICHVPDALASAGAVIEGIGRSVMGMADRTPLIDALAETTRAILDEAEARALTPLAVARARARQIVASQRRARGGANGSVTMNK
jgi:leucine dehydrogenase